MLRALAWANIFYQVMILIVLITGYTSMKIEERNNLAQLAYLLVMSSVALASVLSLGVLVWQ